MRNTRDLSKKIRNTKGTFHAERDTIKDRNGMDLTEAEDIKKRWQEYTEDLYKSDINDADKHNGYHNGKPQWCDCSSRARHLRVRSQIGLRKHHYEQS